MCISKAMQTDMPQLLQLWAENFDDGSPGFLQFAFTLCPIENIYLLKKDQTVVSMLMAIPVNSAGKSGFYLYSACTQKQHRGKGYMHKLIQFAWQDQLAQGKTFCILQPANESLFDFYKQMGFETITYLRKCTIDIKRNLWANADFDIVTASRFLSFRNQFSEDEIVHFTAKGYEKLAEYIYTWGGSTVETKDAYGVYYFENNQLVVKELFAKSTAHAILLLQAIREKTGAEIATVYLSQNSNLFLGEGTLVAHCLIKGLEKEVYANLMFD